MLFFSPATTVVALLTPFLAVTKAQTVENVHPDHTDTIGWISQQCLNTIVPYTSDFGLCFRVSHLLNAVTKGTELLPNTDKFLHALCDSSTPACDPQTLSEAAHNVAEACATDIAGTPGGIPALMLLFLQNFDMTKELFCSKNLQGQFCMIEALTSLQGGLGLTITYPMLRDAVSRNSTYFSALHLIRNTGALCTGCIGKFVYSGNHFNTSVMLPNATTRLQAKCGESFGSVRYPQGVAVQSIAKASTTKSGQGSSGVISDSWSASWRISWVQLLAGAVISTALAVVL